jgi:hypothetical protein
MLLKKINISLTFVMVLSANINAIQTSPKYNEKEITSPYKPGFAARHHEAINTGKSLLVAGGTCALGALASGGLGISAGPILVSGGLGIRAFALSYLYHKRYNRQELVDSLLINPLQALDHMTGTENEFLAEVEKRDLINEKDMLKHVKQFELLAQKYEKKSPLLFFGECTDFCWATRWKNPHYRNNFENQVSKNLVTKIESTKEAKETPITYTSFACGGALSEIIILTKTLAKKPNAHLTIHLIDLNHEHYVSFAKECGLSREINVGQTPIDFPHQLIDFPHHQLNETIKKIPKKSWFSGFFSTKNNDDEIKDTIFRDYFCTQKKYQHAIGWLTKTFPQAKLSLFIHDSTDSYLTYLDEHNLPHADVISAADFQDDIGSDTKAVNKYATLCSATENKKPNYNNTWLGVFAKDKTWLGGGLFSGDDDTWLGLLGEDDIGLISFSPKLSKDAVIGKNARKVKLDNRKYGYFTKKHGYFTMTEKL